MRARQSVIIQAQRFIAVVSYALTVPFAGRYPVTWLVGVQELASMVIQLGAAIPGSRTVVNRPHAFYEAPYDVVIERGTGRRHVLRNLFLGPLLLGSVAARAQGVVYVGDRGFLHAADDEREWEFGFLKRRRRHVVVVFTGNDIRSPALMTRMAEQTGFDNIGAILARQGAPFDSPAYEAARRRRAEVCDNLASAIYSAPVDQLSYIKREVLPFPYLYPDGDFRPAGGKFEDMETIRIVHAPSNPTLKGTDIVRSAVRALGEQFPNVSYTELTGVDNAAVKRALEGAHIVLNQFHAYMPGVFGIEALAHECVMVCSADPTLEPALAGAEGAWIVADSSTLHDRLADLLSHPEALRAQARRGFEWAKANASQSGRGATLLSELEQISAAVVR